MVRDRRTINPGIKFFLSVNLCALAFYLFFMAADGYAGGYDSMNRRDPLVPLIGANGGTANGSAGFIDGIENVILQGIAKEPDGSFSAIINGEIVKEGDKIGKIAVQSISDNSVSIKINDKIYKVKLYE